METLYMMVMVPVLSFVSVCVAEWLVAETRAAAHRAAWRYWRMGGGQ